MVCSIISIATESVRLVLWYNMNKKGSGMGIMKMALLHKLHDVNKFKLNKVLNMFLMIWRRMSGEWRNACT